MNRSFHWAVTFKIKCIFRMTQQSVGTDSQKHGYVNEETMIGGRKRPSFLWTPENQEWSSSPFPMKLNWRVSLNMGTKLIKQSRASSSNKKGQWLLNKAFSLYYCSTTASGCPRKRLCVGTHHFPQPNRFSCSNMFACRIRSWFIRVSGWDERHRDVLYKWNWNLSAVIFCRATTYKFCISKE